VIILKDDECLEKMEPLREEWAQEAIDKYKKMIIDLDALHLKAFADQSNPSLTMTSYSNIKAIEARKAIIEDPFRKALLKQITLLMQFDKPRFLVAKQRINNAKR